MMVYISDKITYKWNICCISDKKKQANLLKYVIGFVLEIQKKYIYINIHIHIQ